MIRVLFSVTLLMFAIAGHASDTSTITVKNKSNDTVRVYTYDGDDSICLIDYQNKEIDSGTSESMECVGGGESLCKVLVSVPEYEDTYACVESTLSACGVKDVIKVSDGATLVIDTDWASCSVDG